jgi:hypothetical protein
VPVVVSMKALEEDVMDTTFKLVGVCRALGALPGFVGAAKGFITLFDIPVPVGASAEIGSVVSALSMLGALKIVAIAYERFGDQRERRRAIASAASTA